MENNYKTKLFTILNNKNMSSNLLAEFKTKAVQAHYGTSFSPEKRGENMIKDYGEELNSDIEELSKDHNVSHEAITDYIDRYKHFFSSYLGAKSNCISSMIAGPSKFPVRRAEKANRSEQRHYEIFREWRKRAKAANVRRAQPEKTFVSELDRYKSELEGMRKSQETMKSANAIIRKAKGKDCHEELVKAGLRESTAREILKPGGWWGIGFAPFLLTNNNANIKRVQQRIIELEQKEASRQKDGEKEYSFEGGRVVMNFEVDRIQILFSERPTREQLEQWKSKGLSSFNWSPSNNCWQRKITENATKATKQMLRDMYKELVTVKSVQHD